MQRPRELDALIDDIRRERIERARQMSADEKFLAGYQLFRRAVSLMTIGVRGQFPDADEAEVQRIVDDRLARTHNSDEHGMDQKIR